MQTLYFLSGGAITLTLTLGGADISPDWHQSGATAKHHIPKHLSSNIHVTPYRPHQNLMETA